MFLDDNSGVIYVGKAKTLRKRVQSYFRHCDFASPRLRKLVESIRDISVIRTESEAEALIVEARLIKQYQPFFNIDLKMGDRYPYVKITDEPFPRIVITRRRDHDGAGYIGPFVSVRELRQMFRMVERYFPLRTCKGDSRRGSWRERPCVRYELGKCSAPCAGKADHSEYRERVADIILLLKGQSADLVGRLRERMDRASGSLDFENAARLRDTIRSLWKMSRQHVSFALTEPPGSDTWSGLLALKEGLALSVVPWRIEGFDVSHFSGGETFGVCVVFEQGISNPGLYRKFRIRSVEGVDDFRAIRETVERRYSRVVRESGALPQLILVDGGSQQLRFALNALESVGLSYITCVAIAKREELIYIPGKTEPVRFPEGSQALLILQRVRDESHRFAIAANRNAGRKRMSRSALEEIPGIGKIRSAGLLSKFGSVGRISALSTEALAKMPGIGPDRARKILNYLGASEGGDVENPEGNG
ncbi:MAG: excinuclease ABC subunit UvrC [Thermovirgaceae bacterium]|nr:excinuclease ABC subunit UvrC [Thermovirgaceae bacterium]